MVNSGARRFEHDASAAAEKPVPTDRRYSEIIRRVLYYV